MFQLRLGAEPLLSQGNEPDIVVALNRQAVREAAPLVQKGALVLHPPFGGPCEELPEYATALEIDFKELAVSETGSSRGKNIAAAGVLLGLLGIDQETATGVVREMFKGKGEDVTESNVNALDAGYDEGQRLASHATKFQFVPSDPHPRMVLSGNEAVALGALAAGVQFFAGYPITPASEIMEWLAGQLPKVNGVMFQAEDEIAALGMCIGASFGGVKSMTATSGPGLSLMIELLGLAGMAEIPIVVVDVQRAGPSTGMPTKEAQGDLILAAQGTHGEIPRVVIAPQTVADCFRQTIRAVNIAHKFQIPVIVLSSQSLSHRMQTIEPPDMSRIEVVQEQFYSHTNGSEPYLRYREQEDGMPAPRSVPGEEGGMYRCGGLEHDEAGNPDFDPAMRTKMVERRRRRMRAIARAFRGESYRYDGDQSSPFGLMSWGASAPVAREAIADLEARGIHVRALLPHVLWPMPDIAIRSFLASGIKTLFVVELNATRQYAEMIRARYTRELVAYGIEVVSITKDEGLPFTPVEVMRAILDRMTMRHLQSTEASR
jgi:2-oxoglutarate ferredoxin oxidoreductase subunit alpha